LAAEEEVHLLEQVRNAWILYLLALFLQVVLEDEVSAI